MAFPTTPMLDDFERADEEAIGAPNWTSGIYPGETLQIEDGELCRTLPNYGSAFWSDEAFGADQEVWLIFGPTLFGGGNQHSAGMEPAVRGADWGTSPDGYFFHFQGHDVTLYKMDGGAQSQIGATESSVLPTWEVGDGIGVAAVGPLLQAWMLDGGVWSQVAERDVSVLDGSPYLGGGNIGLLENGGFFEEFGGGDVSAGGVFLPQAIMYQS